MTDIIKKLGIKEIESFSIHGYESTCRVREVRELEKQRNELLKALIEDVLSTELFMLSVSSLPFKDEHIERHKSRIALIEKACYPKSWEEIKELLG